MQLDPRLLLTFILTAGPCLWWIRRREAALRRREETISGLYALSVEAAGEASVNDLIVALERHLEQLFGASVQVVLHGEEPAVPLRVLAALALEQQRPVGRFTGTHPHASAMCIPLQVAGRPVGVMLLDEFSADFERRHGSRLRMLRVAAMHTAVCIEKARLTEEQSRQNLQVARDKLLSAVISSLSHDLRTPLAAILSTLASLRAVLHRPDKAELLIAGAETQVRRADAFIDNLMTVARLESGMLSAASEPILLADTVAGVLHTLQSRLAGREVRLQLPADLPLLCINAGLMHTLLLNVCDNACKYVPLGRLLIIRAYVADALLHIEIEDDGAGIPAEAAEAAFRKFSRLQHADRGPEGVGLGLYICRTLMRAYGGDMTVARGAEAGGACFRMSVPLRHTRPLPDPDDDDML